jgi:DNA-binding NarL/FixJ family response regulator
VLLILAAVAIEPAASRQVAVPASVSIVEGAIKTAIVYGWIVYALIRTKRLEDPLERTGSRRVVWRLLNGFLVLDLTLRDEARLVGLLAKGLSNKEIASQLFISTDTVKKHTDNVYRKLGVQNRVYLSDFVRSQGFSQLKTAPSASRRCCPRAAATSRVPVRGRGGRLPGQRPCRRARGRG